MNSLWWKFTCCNEYWDCLLRKYVNNVFCVLSRNVKCDLRNAIQICLLQKLFEMIRFHDHAWSSHRQFFSDCLISLLTNDACSFSIIEWRMSVLDLSSDVFDETLSLTKHLIKLEVKRLIKLESDSSNLTKATYQTWRERRHFIKFDESVISSLTRTSSH
jgi:hypothetical protein